MERSRFFTVAVYLSLSLLLTIAVTAVSAQDIPIAYGGVVEGTVSASNAAHYAFDGAAGDTISITGEAVDGSFELSFGLRDPYSESLTSGTGEILNYYLAASGTYELDVLAKNGSGDITFTLERTSTAEDRVVLFEEDFEDNENEWETGGNDAINADVTDGKYMIDAACDSGTWFGAPGLNTEGVVPLVDADYVAEVDVLVSEGEGAATIGAMFGVVQPGYQDFQMLYYDIAGFFEYRYLSSGSIEGMGINDTRDAEIADGEVHHLAMRVQGEDVYLFIDGVQVVRNLGGAKIPAGTVGLVGGCGMYDSMQIVHIEYDNLVVTAAPEADS